MFEQFTERARRVTVLTQDVAHGLGRQYIGTEHLLLSLIHESIGGVASATLESMGIDLATVRQRVEEAAGRGEGVTSGYVPFTQHAKGVFPRALRESRSLGHGHVGTEHILLSLLDDTDGVAVEVLTGLGVTLKGTRAQVLGLLGGSTGAAD